MLRTLAARRLVPILGAVMLLALAIAGFYLSSDNGSPVEAATGGPEMALNIKGGNCDDAVRPTECDVPLGAQFTLSVDALGIPSGGYIFAGTFIRFGPDLTYVPTAAAADEVLWPDCVPEFVDRGQFDATSQDPFWNLQNVNHGCLTEGNPTLTISTFVGNIVEIALVCTTDDTSYLVSLLPDGHPIAVTLGAQFVDHDGRTVVPKVSELLVNCGAGGPLPTPTFTPAIPTPTPTQPPKNNDAFADAVVISDPLPFTNKQSTLGATSGGRFEPCTEMTQTVWYQFTPSTSALIVADTEGSTFNTVLAVCSTLGLIGTDDNAGTGVLSRIIFEAAAGETYHFQIGGATGHLVFNLTSPLSPAKGNDDFAGRIVVDGPLPHSNKQDTTGALVEPGEPSDCGTLASSVWYSYAPPVDSVLLADGSGSDFSAIVAIYQGASLPQLELIKCGGLVALSVEAGQIYHFQVGGCVQAHCAGSAGNLVFDLDETPCLPEGCPQMSFGLSGGSCDDPLRPSTCSVGVGETFGLSIEMVGPPQGYALAQSYISFGSHLTYNPDPTGPNSATNEIVWPDCVFALRFHIPQIVNHGCITGIIPPLPSSSHTGTFIDLSFTCSSTPSSTELELIPEGRSPAGSLGAEFVLASGAPLVPGVSTLTINCVGAPTATPTATPPPFPKMSKLPALQNVWLTRQGAKIPPAGCLAGTDIGSLAEGLSQPIDSPDPKDPSAVQQLAAFEFEVHYDSEKVCVTLTPGAEFEAAGTICITEDKASKPQLEGVARIGCVTIGKGHNIDELVPLAQIHVYPQPELYSQIKPNQNNGVVVQINNVNCDLGDEQGHAIPVFSCNDSDITFRYLEGDVNPDCVVDAVDAQTVAFRWGVQKGSLIYNDFMNLEPSGAQADDDIDVNDLQFVYGRIGSTCEDPHPPQDPVNPKA